jgi:hypothetical protein
MTAWDLQPALDALDVASRQWPVMANELTFDELLVALNTARQIRQGFAGIESEIEREICAVAGEYHLDRKGEIPGVGTFEIRGGKDRREWKHQDLAAEVTRKHLEATGDFEPAALVAAILAAAQVTGWRVTVLKPQGIDPDQYCSSSPGRSTVQITGGVS